MTKKKGSKNNAQLEQAAESTVSTFSANSKTVLVVGGAGYVGQCLMQKFLDLNYSVACFDFILPPSSIATKVQVEQGEISNAAHVLKVFQKIKPTIVIHLASIGMSGSAMLNDACYLVNIVGTRNIVTACVAEDVKCLVYCSTYNVTFGGQEIINGNEATLEYFPFEQAYDKYGPSKGGAERMVICAFVNYLCLSVCSCELCRLFLQMEPKL